jgi:hypothetical protein
VHIAYFRSFKKETLEGVGKCPVALVGSGRLVKFILFFIEQLKSAKLASIVLRYVGQSLYEFWRCLGHKVSVLRGGAMV